MNPFDIKVNFKDDIAIVVLSGRSTAVNKQSEEVTNLRDNFKELVKQGYKKVIVDLDLVEYIASDTIGALLSGNSILKKADGRLAVCNINNYVKKIFDVVKLGDVLPLYDTFNEAEKSFS